MFLEWDAIYQKEGVVVREVNVKAKGDGKVTTIAMITDSHLKYNDDNSKESLLHAMDFASSAEQVVLCGDSVESVSDERNLELFNQIVWDKYPETIAVLGNHEYFYPIEDTVDELKKKVDVFWKHNPNYYSKLINNKVLIVTCDNARQSTSEKFKYYFTEDKCDMFEKDIQYSRQNGYIILLFYHVGFKRLDLNYNGNRRMYELITNNADVVKACFSGHTHYDTKEEMEACCFNESGTTCTSSIPCYTLQACTGPKGQGNVLLINVD